MSAATSTFWDDTPVLSPDQIDYFVHDGGEVVAVHAPRQNAERPRIRAHDFRSAKERAQDSRTAKEIVRTPVRQR